MTPASLEYPDFVSAAHIEDIISFSKKDPAWIDEILQKSLSLTPLTLEEAASLISTTDRDSEEKIFNTARELKRRVYGNRIVIFAPLYVGNECVNDCTYCAFRRSNSEASRITLSPEQLGAEIVALESVGHKRLILVFGEHTKYDANFIADSVRTAYATKIKNGEIRRVNINAAPMDIEGYRIVKEAGIGTYQIFQETYHRQTYSSVHPKNSRKGDYMYRLHGLSRALEAGIDDVGIGALFGLYDWKYDLLALLAHADFLQKKYGIGPHTVSFPRIKRAMGTTIDEKYFVSDRDFKKLVAILRLSIPYTGMILTAREGAEVRKDVMEFGVSQIDAGSHIELGGYSKPSADTQDLAREQFELGDMRTLDQVISELVDGGFIPSFCTSCYRVGRTGEIFMEYAIPGFINKFCTPNAIMTFAEYLMDFASDDTRRKGFSLIDSELIKIDDPKIKDITLKALAQIKDGSRRDVYL